MATNPKAFTKALELQEALSSSCLLLKEDIATTTDKELRARLTQAMSSAVKSWDTLEDRKRVFKGRPLPGSLRPERKAPKRKVTTHAITEAPESGTIEEGTAPRPKESLSPRPEGVAGGVGGK